MTRTCFCSSSSDSGDCQSERLASAAVLKTAGSITCRVDDPNESTDRDRRLTEVLDGYQYGLTIVPTVRRSAECSLPLLRFTLAVLNEGRELEPEARRPWKSSSATSWKGCTASISSSASTKPSALSTLGVTSRTLVRGFLSGATARCASSRKVRPSQPVAQYPGWKTRSLVGPLTADAPISRNA